MKPMIENIRRNIILGVDVLLPPRCPVSGIIVDAPGMTSSELWGKLDFISDPACGQCGLPFELSSDGGVLCIKCLKKPPYYDYGRSALRYNDASRSLILSFKHGDNMHLVRSFVPWLVRSGRLMLEDADMLIPVPLHPYRLLMRRYNQAAVLAAGISAMCGVVHEPLILKRVRSTVSQGHLSANERMRNVRKAFDVPDKKQAFVKGKNIVLIDDVYTSGATLNECSRILKKYGATKVSVLTIARVIYDD